MTTLSLLISSSNLDFISGVMVVLVVLALRALAGTRAELLPLLGRVGFQGERMELPGLQPVVHGGIDEPVLLEHGLAGQRRAHHASLEVISGPGEVPDFNLGAGQRAGDALANLLG